VYALRETAGRVTPHASPCSGKALASPVCHAFGGASLFRACFWLSYGEIIPSLSLSPVSMRALMVCACSDLGLAYAARAGV
jgi:hypothetical protein